MAGEFKAFATSNPTGTPPRGNAKISTSLRLAYFLSFLASHSPASARSRNFICRSFSSMRNSGAKRLRAGFPPSWCIGDKTETSDNGAMGDNCHCVAPDSRSHSYRRLFGRRNRSQRDPQ